MRRSAVRWSAVGRWARGPLLLAVAALVAACGDPAPTRPTAAQLDASITVASFNFGESALLGEIYAQALERAGFRVDRQLRLGSRELVQPSLQQGMVDLVPEYLGSALSFLAPSAPSVPEPGAARRRLQSVYDDHGVVVLEPSTAQNQNGFVVLRETAEAHGLVDISDLAPVADQLVFGGPPECRRRPLCLAGLEQVYGLTFADFEALDSSGPLTVAALLSGRVDVALLFTTNGSLAGGDLTLLRDDRNLQPAENVVPVLRQAIVARHGDGVVRTVEDVTRQLDTSTLVTLNRRVDRGERVAAVATGWLTSRLRR